MSNANERFILETAVKTYGNASQIDMMIEEMSELTKALLKYRRDPAAEHTMNSILEEMADVEIMLEQMKIIFGSPVRWKTLKLKRLAERMGMRIGN